MPRLPRPVAFLATVGALAAFRHWHTRWGTFPSEPVEPLPGDEIEVSRFGMRATRGITIEAPPEAVWPWIAQIGAGKAGWYSYDLLDNLGRPSATELLPRWHEVSAGDPAGAMNPFTGPDASPWRVAEVDPPHVMLWHNPAAGTWVWVVRPHGEGTRLIARIRISYATPGGLAFAPLLEMADFWMFRRMLLGIKQRAERTR